MTTTTTKKWYRKPEIIIGVFGIIFPILASYIINNYEDDKRELSINYSLTEALISENDDIINNLKISYDSAVVENISKLTFKIKNTGNISLTKSDFSDGPINIKINYLNGSKSLILQLRQKENAGQQNSQLKFTNNSKYSNINYFPSLMNVKDEVLIECYLLNTPSTKISVSGKIFNGVIIGPKPIEGKSNNGYENFVLSLTNVFFFNSKSIATVILMSIFFFVSMSTLFQWASVNEPKQKNVKGLMRMMTYVTGLIAIFILILIVSIFLYI